MSANKQYWYLENINLQDFFCPSKLDHPDPKLFKKGEFIYFPTDEPKKVYFVQQGRVKIGTYSDDGKEIIKAILHPGEIFGELALLGQREHTEFAQSMGKVTICAIPLKQTQALMAQHPDFSIHITKMIGEKLIHTQRRLEDLVFKDARTRVIEFLHDLAEEKGDRMGYEQIVRQFFTHQEIANITGTSRQTVTTILNELREENYIFFDRKKLIVRDMDKLQALAVAAANKEI